MTLTVKHAFHSAIPDDPAAVLAGEVVPSNWNADHVITGMREVLTANRTYYVSTTGNNTTGDGSIGNPWATAQHAYSVILGISTGNGLFLNGWFVTIQYLDGTYPDDGFNKLTISTPWFGGGGIVVQGNLANPAAVILQGNDNNVCFNVDQVDLPGYLEFKNVTVQGYHVSVGGFGTGNINCDNLIHDNVESPFECGSNGQLISVFGTDTHKNSRGSIGFSRYGGNIQYFPSTLTLTGTPNFVNGTFRCTDPDSAILYYPPTVVGTATGPKWRLDGGEISCKSQSVGDIPGSTEGIRNGTGKLTYYLDNTSTDAQGPYVNFYERIKLSANKTFYINADTGTDFAWLGLTSLTPFRTAQFADDTICDHYDLNGHIITFQVQDATAAIDSVHQTKGYFASANSVNFGTNSTVYWRGNVTTPANTKWTATGGYQVYTQAAPPEAKVVVYVNGFKCSNTLEAILNFATVGAEGHIGDPFGVDIPNLIVTDTPNNTLIFEGNVYCEGGNVTMDWTGNVHTPFALISISNGQTYWFGTITIINNPTFTKALLTLASEDAFILWNGSVSGAFVGKQYDVSKGLLRNFGGSSRQDVAASGSLPGTLSQHGQYADSSLKITTAGGAGVVADQTQSASPTTGSTLTFAENQGLMNLTPAGTLATLTINMKANPYDNELVYINTTQTVTAVTIGGGTIVGAMTSLPIGETMLRYSATAGKWFWISPSSGGGGGSSSLVIGTTPITSGTAKRVLYEDVFNVLDEATKFTIESNQPNVLSGSAYLYNTVPMARAITANSNYFLANAGNLTLTGGNNHGVGDTALGLVSSGVSNTGVGNAAGAAITTSNSNTFVGDRAGQNTDASNNTAVGTQALRFNSTGTNNTAIGANCLSTPTAATTCTAIGSAAMNAATGGSNCVAIGTGTLNVNTSGANNVALGSNALGSNTTGSNNNASGANALGSNTTGSNNNADGSSALSQNTTGSSNFGFGPTALGANIDGNDNVAIGDAAIRLAQHDTGNVGIGKNALHDANGGGTNTAIGNAAGSTITTGANNIAIGSYSSTASITSGSNNIQIGGDVAVPSATASNQLSIGNYIYGTGLSGTQSTISSGSIGIGVKAPVCALDVAGSVKTQAVTVAGLPAAGNKGARNFVTDSNATLAAGLGNIVATGGANNVPVYDDGTNWRIG